jgi:hypothetical protein
MNALFAVYDVATWSSRVFIAASSAVCAIALCARPRQTTTHAAPPINPRIASPSFPAEKLASTGNYLGNLLPDTLLLQPRFKPTQAYHLLPGLPL